jgi:hypothetical protein
MITRPKSGVAVLVPLVVPALAVLCYLSSLDGEFVWDDQKLILEDQAAKSPNRLAQAFTEDFFFRRENDLSYGYYRPLTTLSYIADYALFGPSPRSFHAVNIANRTRNPDRGRGRVVAVIDPAEREVRGKASHIFHL